MADQVILEFLVRKLDRMRDQQRVLEDQKIVLTRSMTELRDMYRMLLERLEHRYRKPKSGTSDRDPTVILTVSRRTLLRRRQMIANREAVEATRRERREARGSATVQIS